MNRFAIFLPFLLGVGLTSISPGNCLAQPSSGLTPAPTTQPLQMQFDPDFAGSYYRSWGTLDPIADRIRAVGDYYVRMGYADMEFATAAKLWEEAKQEYVKTRLIQVQGMYERREIRWQEKQIAAERILKEKQGSFARKVATITTLPIDSLEGDSGKRLNILLDQIYQYGNSMLDVEEFAIPSSINEDINFWMGAGSRKARVRFKGEISCTPPPVLEKPPFADLLNKYMEARSRLVETLQDGQPLSNDVFDRANRWLDELDIEVYNRLSPETVLIDGDGYDHKTFQAQWNLAKEARDFIERQTDQLRWMAVTRKMPATFDGRSLQDLVSYMKTNGYRFADSDPGAEDTYASLARSLSDMVQRIQETNPQ